ncbi:MULTISPECIES: hypothetical protein [unclassified Marinobacter]|uniref:hypothetical protein n=1 Tax=unclassified Marinobacter TaxID=83889 RepID=UPI0026E2110C|nr:MULTISPECIES: hypothetical protein [unclassified Marinobacter]MDO6441566.1 hypothetical protein [Marinobacter sp. 2_MG-2023]MDO6822272.1 hypothetical protein [Marinobacter sp. 1_MG-2023]
MNVLHPIARSSELTRSALISIAFLLMVAGSVSAQSNAGDGLVFELEQRSTLETIPFRSIAEDDLSDTVIEGGLAAPAEGVPVQPAGDDDFYLDPLALQPGDSRTDLGRSEIPVEFRFSTPKSIPGQTHSNNYVIRPPENRTYDALNVNMTDR